MTMEAPHSIEKSEEFRNFLNVRQTFWRPYTKTNTQTKE
jgi:hypothetical protein